MSKKFVTMAAGIAMIASIAIAGGYANAQLFPYTGTSTAPSGTVIVASSTVTSTFSTNSTISSTVTTTVPSVIIPTSVIASGAEYLQFNGLTVTGISSSSTPAQILAANLTYLTVGESGPVMATATTPVSCEQFVTDSAPIGTETACPIPPVAPILSTTSASSTVTAPISYSPYTLNVSPTTQLLLSDRTPAVLENIMPGDVINVYGFFNSADDSVNAEVIRDLSKPVGAATVIPAIPVTPGIGSTPDTSTPAVAIATSSAAIAQLQSYISQLETLVAQLQAEVSSSATTSVSAPMIPVPAATSSEPTVPATAPAPTTGTGY